jgi:hypothetical protein
LVGQRVIAMALLRPGWEKSYYGRPAIDPVVCAGRILSHEQLPDGKYNFLLQGAARCRIIEEVERDEPYRIARLQKIEEVPALEIDLEECRRQMTEVFDESPLRSRGTGKQFRQMVRSVLPTTDVALKQSLLAEADVRRRVTRIVEALQSLAAATPPAQQMNVSPPSDPHLN